MCGRYTREYTWREVHDFLDLRWPSPDPELPPSYNVAPTQVSAIVRVDDDGRPRLRVARWGLVPSWARDAAIGSTMINARAETLSTKPAFRTAFARRRCVVPATAFYEWQVVSEGRSDQPDGESPPAGKRSRARRGPAKQPWYIRREDGHPLCFAGLWERWSGAGAEAPLDTFTIVTREADRFMRRLHDRMPAILEREAIGPWLNAGSDDSLLQGLLGGPGDARLAAHPVSLRVGNPRNDDAELTREIDPRRGEM